MSIEPFFTARDALRAGGFDAYLVGGCVRDILRGCVPHDLDVATIASPLQVVDTFEPLGWKVVPTGIRHGTVTLVRDGVDIEVTTFRTDGDYSDNRRPDSVKFASDIAVDLSRRDFTMNAIAYDGENFVDPFGGKSDIERGIIRCVGDPAVRFSEDALRILRMLRFASCLGFEVDKLTFDAAVAARGRLLSLSCERVASELNKMLVGDNLFFALTNGEKIITTILPELAPTVGYDQNNPHHQYDLYNHIVRSTTLAPPHLKLVMLLHDIGKLYTRTTDEQGVSHYRGHPEASAKIADEIMRRLKYDNSTRHRVVEFVRIHDKPLPTTEAGLRRWLGRMGEDFFDLLQIKCADAAGRQDAPCDFSYLVELENKARALLENKSCIMLTQLAINGDDLIAAGFTQGKIIGKTLVKLLDDVIFDRCPNEYESLLERAKK